LGGRILCDECGNFKPLRDEWYWCLQCGRDLCAVHEAVDAHDDTHVFVLFKSVVDINAFRCVALALFPSASWYTFPDSRTANSGISRKLNSEAP
jgi:hypothetical protein